MRNFFIVLLILLFGVTFPLAVHLFSVSLVLNPDYIKDQLVKIKGYEVAADQIENLVKNNEKSEVDEIKVKNPNEEKIKQTLLSQVDSKYLKGKVETFIDQNYSWINGDTTEQPYISFKDLEPEAKKLASGHQISDEWSEFFDKQFKPNIENPSQARNIYEFINYSPYLLALISLVILGAIFFLARGLKAKLRRVSIAIFLPTFFGLLWVGLGFALGKTISNIAKSTIAQSDLPDLQEPVAHLIANISQDLSKTSVIIYLLALIFSAILFTGSFFVEKKKNTTEPLSQ